ncbi:hypothetical protein C8R46DRAFT_1224338 [Mycena filopes]|nr:hypothetical protein C8R46DRAFT_1224338 [Mycena filopes]
MPRLFAELPLELIDAVASECSPVDLLVLCRTNRSLYDVCLRRVYKTIVPASAASAIRVFKTLLANKRAALHVKTLLLRDLPDDLLQAFTRLLTMTLLNLTSLETLHLVTTPSILDTNVHLPCLRDCMIPLSAETAPFLRRHPKVTSLRVIIMDPPSLHARFPPVSLTDLQQYSGPQNVARAVAPGSKITNATILWNSRPQNEYPEVLGALAKSRGPVQVLRSMVHEWDPGFLFALPGHLPDLTALHIHNTLPPVEDELQVSYSFRPHISTVTLFFKVFFSAVGETLKSFPHLTQLVLTSLRTAGAPAPTPADLAVELAALHSWGTRSAVLVTCTLPSDTIWDRWSQNVWIPHPVNRAESGLSWPIAWLVRTVVKSPAELPGYSEAMEELWGKDNWAVLKAAIEAETST